MRRRWDALDWCLVESIEERRAEGLVGRNQGGATQGQGQASAGELGRRVGRWFDLLQRRRHDIPRSDP